MMPLVLPFPAIDPVLVSIGPVDIRWYALAYIVGFILGWLYCRALVRRAALWGGLTHPTPESLDDLLMYVVLGVILGGRLGYVLFYNLPFYAAHPLDALAVWSGGMSFHGGFLGSVLGIALFARRHGYRFWTVGDVLSAAMPIGLLLGRLANFIKPELWGRTTDVAWGVIFPCPDNVVLAACPGDLPRHPSQLYEAGLEGVVLFVILALAIRWGALRRPGIVSGLFCIGYAVARIVSEFFREPDAQLGFLFGGATMGMLLSIPVAAIGIVALLWPPPRRAIA